MRMPLRRRIFRRRSAAVRQLVYAFVQRTKHRERWFKRAITLTTLLVVGLIVRFVPWGSHLSASIDSWAARLFRQATRIAGARAEMDESWRKFRTLGVEQTRPRVRRFFDECDPPYQRLLRYAGMDPDHGLLRWGNYNWTLLLSSKVFEADDRGRSYRLRPLTRSIWLRNVVTGKGFPAFFLVPDGPGLADAIDGTGAVPLESSRQTTNSLGLRGPEPDLGAPLRGLILGDSYMQGMFIGDDDTPPECLRRYLQGRLETRASILNTGVLGYSPEQYYHALIAFTDRFRPHFVVVSLCANDFGNITDATSQGRGDWQEGRYWLQKIALYCKARRTPCLIVPAPVETSMMIKRNSGYYPGILANILDVEPRMFLDPMDDFLNAHMQSRIECKEGGRVPKGCALFNDDIDDSHFSRAGSEVWAESVGRRLVLVLEDDRLLRKPDGPDREDRRPPRGAEDQTGAGEGSKRPLA